MGSHSEIDRAKPIGYQKICRPSEEAVLLFPDLELSRQEQDWCNWTPEQLTHEARTRNEYAITTFRTKIDCCEVVHALLGGNPEPVRRGIERFSTNLTGGALERYVFKQARNIRSNADLQKRIEPVLENLTQAALDEGKQYADRGQPDILDNHFRNFYVLAATVARLKPTPSPVLYHDLSTILRPVERELSPSLALVSLPALAYNSKQICDSDREYLPPWQSDPGSVNGYGSGIHTAAYNSRPEVGWSLLTLHPRDVSLFLTTRKLSITRSLVCGIHRKCCHDPDVNDLRLAARFLKLHQALHVINGKHPYSQLPEDLAHKVFGIAEVVGRAIRPSSVHFEGKADLVNIVGSVESYFRTQMAKTNKNVQKDTRGDGIS